MIDAGWVAWVDDRESRRPGARAVLDRLHRRSPRRLVFEGEPVLEPPLSQDATSRAPMIIDGPPLDTRAACPDLTGGEARLRLKRS